MVRDGLVLMFGVMLMGAVVWGAVGTRPATRPAGPVVVISGGHETVPVDRGRPVVLVAGGLGVSPEVFREAFSRVKPAAGGQEPEPGQVRENKRVLMEALSKYGVTNERLDEVSNMYRYPPGRGHVWKHREAVVKATVEGGKVVGFEVVDGGAGYTSLPEVRVEGYPGVKGKVVLYFGKALEKNGSVASVMVEEAGAATRRGGDAAK